MSNEELTFFCFDSGWVFGAERDVAGSGCSGTCSGCGTVQRIQSIDIPTITNAPFSAVVVTEWTKIMPDGSTALMKNHRTVARDSLGRVFEERRYFTPEGDKQVTALLQVDYKDPVLHQWVVCVVNRRVCSAYMY